ncbi:glycosyltransferase family 4 protein [Pseudomonas knackmussii]|uniref:glycosyltransferase family 4 protein n=1 Tax=Pseudomonas knackmussii TaxID=65741 RepID=UPI003F4A0D45
MKIALANTLYHPYKVGGAEISAQILAESLAKAGHEVHIITLHEGMHIKASRHNEVNIHQIPLKNIYWPFSKETRSPAKRLLWHLLDTYNVASKRIIKNLLKSIEPDILHTNNISGLSVSIWDAADNLGIPIIHTSRDYYLIHPNTTLNKSGINQDPNSLTCRIWSLPKRLKARKVTTHVSISSHVKNTLINAKIFKNCKNLVIYNSITTPHYPADIKNSQKKDSLTYGFIGRITPEKGLKILINAFKSAPASAQLIIAGEGHPNYIRELKQDICTSRIRFIGNITPQDFYPHIDCLIVPSLWEEPLGRVVLESYSYSTPVIAAISGGLPEVVEQGETGFLYKKESVSDLAGILSWLDKATLTSLRSNCRDYSSHFSDESIANSYIKAYLSTIDSHHNRHISQT